MFIRDIFIPYDSEESFPVMLSAISPLLQDLKHGLTHNNCTSTAQAPVNDIPLTEKTRKKTIYHVPLYSSFIIEDRTQ